jgi:hypothetical protein
VVRHLRLLLGGKASITRSTVLMALFVCSVPNTSAHLGGGDRQRDGLEIAHLADQDDVGVLRIAARRRG